MSISANSYLNELSGPVQLHHGTEDTEVPIQFSQGLVQEILTAGMPVEFYEYPGDNHNLSGYFSLAMSRTIEFFDRYLKEGR
jgi:dipeptidyl aminopeptidase/acylaminoacyl peptidase